EDLSERGFSEPEQCTGLVGLVEVFLAEAKESKVEVGATILPFADGICLRDEVSLVAVTQDQAVDPDFLHPVVFCGWLLEGGLEAGTCFGRAIRPSLCSDSEIEAFEKFTEFRVNGFGIREKVPVHIFNKFRV